MRLPWQRQPEENEVVVLKGEKKRETLTQTAEKILQRQMKKDPSGYGLAIAEKLKGVSKQEPKTVADFLKELREYRAAMREAGLEGGEGKGLLAQILEALPSLPGLLAEVRQFQAQGQDYRTPQQQIGQPKFQQIAQAQIQPEAQPNISELKLEKLMVLLELTPEQAWNSLKEANEQDWINFLQTTTYEQLAATLDGVAKANPEYADHIKNFLAQYHEWLQNLLIIAQKDKET